MSGPAPPLSLYLHFPWCVAKCPYCDFNSHSLRGELPAAAYIDALIGELRAQPADVTARPLVSIFLGGGTPSLFPPAELQRLLAVVSDSFDFAPQIEITLEANPGALEHGAFAGYRAAGINRLSLGVQSFADSALQALGRIHNSADVYAAFRDARAAGFDNINLDLMYALPGQTVAAAADDIAQALELAPEHISHYHLTLEPNTVFHARPPADLPDSELAWEQQSVCAGQLQAAGYENYEVSAWGQPGRHSRHNLNYWNFGDYLGLGAGAHGKLTGADGIRREVRAAHPREYLRLAATGAATVHAVTPPDAAFEFMLNVLRLRDGAELSQFERYTGLPATLLEPGIDAARARGLLTAEPAERICPTARGRRFLDDLQAIFLPPA